MTSSVTDLCRLCGTDTFNIVRHHIFEAESLAKCIAKKIAECLPVNVTPQDRLPKHMCGECAYKLDLLSEFRDKAVKTEHLLESLVDGVKPEILENEEPDNDLGADDGFRSDSPDQPEPEVLIKEEDAEPRPERRPVRKAARKVGRPRGRKRKQTEIEPDTEEEVESEEAPKKAVKKEEAPPKVYRKRGRKPKNNKESPGWQCFRCWLIFPTRRQLAQHRQQEHQKRGEADGTETTAICDVCGKEVRFLTQHRRAHFASERRYQCHFCGISYLYKCLLRDHMMTHLDGPAFQCEICAMTFTHRANLRMHNIRKHMQVPVEKKHLCPHCPKRFRAPNLLNRHLLTHTGEKPCVCHVCGKAYQREHQLQYHQIKKHQLMPHNCPVCGQGFRYQKELIAHSVQAHQTYVVDKSRPRHTLLP